MRNTDKTPRPGNAILQIAGLDVFHGPAHALQSVSLELQEGVLAVVGRNGMGKTTLCRAITGLTPASGSIRYRGSELVGLAPDEITRLGVAYVPQGRRVWRSLTVDETLRLSSKTARQGAWTVDRIYSIFPRLAERKSNGGAQLSGGEQQMLAIGRALLFNPGLLVMDEPTEGLAPVIVEQVASLLKQLADERSMSVLLIEQNLGVALEVADDIAIMVNGRIAHRLPAAQLAADRGLQQRLLGLKAGAVAETSDAAIHKATTPVMRLVRAHGSREFATDHAAAEAVQPQFENLAPDVHAGAAVYLAGVWTEQQRDLLVLKGRLEDCGLRVISVDISASGFSTAQVSAQEMARYRPDFRQQLVPIGGAVSPQILGSALSGYLASRTDLGAFLALAGRDSVSVALAATADLPLALPKLLITDAPQQSSSNALLQLHAPVDELKHINEALLAHAAALIAGMLRDVPCNITKLKQR
jgi:ABC-type branched-subunit amino acid transport system ATPase component